MLRATLMTLFAAALLSLPACQSGDAGVAADPQRSTPRRAPAQRIDAIEMMMPPTAISWDDKPGPNGVPVQVYLFRVDHPRPVLLESGELSFLLFEGRVSREAVLDREPIHRWTFTASQLAPASGRTMIGQGYNIPLDWGDRRPGSRHITIIAQYQPTEGRTIYSAPSTIAVNAN